MTHCDTAEVKCPYMSSEYSCQSLIQEIEIRAVRGRPRAAARPGPRDLGLPQLCRLGVM